MVFTNKVDGICFTDKTIQGTAFSIIDKRKLDPILEISTPNVLVIRDELIITEGVGSLKSAIFGPDGLRTTNPDGLQVDSKINMKTNDIDNVDNLDVITINDIPFNLLTQNLESVLTVGNNAENKEIINLQKITFHKNEFNQVYEDISANLIITSPNDIDLSANEINCNCDIDMSNNDIKKINKIKFNKNEFNQVYEDISANLIIQSPNKIDLSANEINCNCDIDMSNNDIKKINKIKFNKNEFNQVYEDISANLIIQSPNKIDLSANEINCNCDINMINNKITFVESVSFNKDSSNKIYEKDITKNLIINSPYDLDLSANNINLNFNEFKLNNLGAGKMIFKNDIKIYDLGANYINSINSYSDPNITISDMNDDRLEIYGLNIFLHARDYIYIHSDSNYMDKSIYSINTISFNSLINIQSNWSTINTYPNEINGNLDLILSNEGSILFNTFQLGNGNLLWNDYSVGMNWTKTWNFDFNYQASSSFYPVSELSFTFPEKFLNSKYYITFSCNFYSDGSRPRDPQLALYFEITDDGGTIFPGYNYSMRNPWGCYFNRSEFDINPMPIIYSDIYNLQDAKNRLKITLYFNGSIDQSQNVNITINFQKTNLLEY